MPDTLTISNDGPEIVETNYWQSALARTGTCYLSPHAGCFRLLLPPQHVGAVRAIRMALRCVVSRGPYPARHWPDALELLFDDGHAPPFRLPVSPEAMDHLPPDQDRRQSWTLAVWTHRVGTTGRKVLEKPCHYRRVRQLPDCGSASL